jgi:G3E family GTPase
VAEASPAQTLHAPVPRRLPLTVVGGFLGAGKTTLLQHWLRHANGLRLAILVNDFGALNLDATLIASHDGDTFALTNGCVCCQIGDDMGRALGQVLDRAADFDAVVIEASGVSDPWRIAQLGRADPGLGLDGVVVVLDASCAWAQAHDPLLADTLLRQVRAADHLVLNHCDQASATELQAVQDWLHQVAPGIAQWPTTQAQLPLAVLSSTALPEAPRWVASTDTARPLLGSGWAPQHGQQFASWSCQPQRRFALNALQAWLKAPPAGLLRLKGFLLLDTGPTPQWVELQFAGRQGSVRKCTAPTGGAALVAIGLATQLPSDALHTFFGDTEHDNRKNT